MTANGSLRNSLVISTCLHVAMLLFLFFGLPTLFKPLPPISRPIPFEIVEIAAMTNTRVQDKPDEPAKPPAPQPKPPTPVESKPPEPQKPEPKPQEPVPQQQAELAVPTPQAKPKPPEPTKPAPPPPDMLASVLKNVAKLKPTPPKVESQENAPEKSDAAEPRNLAPSLSDRLTISEEDALRRQISQCWNMPVGAKNAQDLIVEVLITVNPDRTVREAQVVDQSRMASDPYFRSAAESALRALRSPKCSPLELSPDKYEQWKTIRFNFDPRDML